jgi:hypothetical protein
MIQSKAQLYNIHKNLLTVKNIREDIIITVHVVKQRCTRLEPGVVRMNHLGLSWENVNSGKAG